MGGFLTTGYCSKTTGYYFLEIFFWGGGKALIEGNKNVIGTSPSPPTRENPEGRPLRKKKCKFENQGSKLVI